jgi:Na+/proline symporter
MRLFAAKDAANARKSLSLTAFLIFVFHILGYLGIAGAALVLAPKLVKVDQTLLITMDALFPPVLKGLTIAGIIAAAMSTSSGMLLTAGAELSSNIYKRFIRQDATPQQTLRLGKIVILVLIVIAAILALLHTQSIGVIVALCVEGSASAFMVPLIMGLWWRRANGLGGFLGVAGGFITFLLVHFVFPVPMFAEILFSAPASFLGIVIGSLLTSAPKPEKVDFLDHIHGVRAALGQSTGVQA